MPSFLKYLKNEGKYSSFLVSKSFMVILEKKTTKEKATVENYIEAISF